MRELTRILLALAVFWVAATPAAAQQLPSVPELHGLVQIWFATDDSIGTFRVRRTELKLTGQITQTLRWTAQIDPSRADRILQDAVLHYGISRALTIDAGQFKVPLSREGLQSSSRLETVERALFASAENKLADVRNIGVQARAALGAVALQAGVFNDLNEGSNRLDANAQKAVAGRAVLQLPLLPGLALGISGGHTIALGNDTAAAERSRWGADAQFTNARFTLRTELLGGTDGQDERIGYYVLAAVRPLPRWEAAVRVDSWDPDTDLNFGLATARERDYVAGLSYLLDGQTAKLQVNFVRKTFAGEVAPARNLLLFNGQVAW